MDETDDIDVEIVESEEIEDIEPIATERKSVGLVPVLILSLLAALTGAVGGAFGAQYFTKSPDASAINNQISRQAADIEDKSQKAVASLKTQLAALKTDLMEVQVGQASEQVLSSLQNRLEVLETAPVLELPQIDAEALTALQNAQADGFDWPDLTGIEAKISELEESYSNISDRLQIMSEAIQDLESSPAKAVTLGAADTPVDVTQNFALPAFPETALRDAAKQMTKGKGFFARTLNKHIDVKKPNDPLVLIEKSAAAMKSGEISQAINLFDQLPAEIKAVGQDWRDAASQL